MMMDDQHVLNATLETAVEQLRTESV